jgi:hypothetical protein
LEQIKNVTFTETVAISPQAQLLQQYKGGGKESDGDGMEKEKHVSFGNELQLHIIESNESNESNASNESNESNANDLSFIFNKLKRIKKSEKDEYKEEHENSNSRTILKISQDIEGIKNTLAELTDKINKLCHSTDN